MLSKLSKYIDKEAFIQDVYRKIPIYNNIIVDSFVSNQCNLHCKHCYFLDYKPKRIPISYERWVEIIEECINIGIRHFHFSGKEPFCDKRFLKILSLLNTYSNNYDLFYGLVTNGSSINPLEIQDLLSSNLSYLEISIEGLYNYDQEIRGESHFDKINVLINEIADKRKINLTSTIFENNQTDLIEVLKYFCDKGITKFNFASYMDFNMNKLNPVKEIESSDMLIFFERCRSFLESRKNQYNCIDIRLCFTRKQCYDLFVKKNAISDMITEKMSKGGGMVYKIGNHILELNFPLLNIPFMNQLVITHEGYVISCADDIHFDKFDKLSLGNLFYESVSQIIEKRSQYIINYLKAKLDYDN